MDSSSTSSTCSSKATEGSHSGLDIYPIPVKDGIEKYDFAAYVGSTSGIFKGLEFKRDEGPKCRNILGPKQLSDITAMSWGDNEECDILIALKNCSVRVFESRYKKNFIKCLPTDLKQGIIRSVSRYNNTILAAFESGVVKNLKSESEDQVVINTGKHLWRMRHNEVNGNHIITGGRDSNMKLWDLPTKTLLYEARNVKPDELQLKVPVFISDLCFIPETTLVGTCSKYGYVNVYDSRSQQRLPILNTVIKENVFTCITPAPKDRHVVVGNSTGQMYLLDMRWPNKSASKYKGFQGAISAIACHNSEPYIVSTSYDHYVRVHHMNTTALMYKAYNPTPLHFLLMRSDFSFENDPISDDNEDNDVVVLDSDRLQSNRDTISEVAYKKIKYSVSTT